MRETTATSLGASPCLHNGNRKAPKLLSWGLFVCLSAIAFAIDSIAQVPHEMQVICSRRLGAVFFYALFAAGVDVDVDDFAAAFSPR